MIRIRFYRGGTYHHWNMKKAGSFYLEFKDLFEVANFFTKEGKRLSIYCYDIKKDLTPEQLKFLDGRISRISKYRYKALPKVFSR